MYHDIKFFELDYHSCGAPLPWASARKQLEAEERKEAEHAQRGPSFARRWWTRGVQEAAIEGTHVVVKNVLIALGTFVAGVLIGALSPLGELVRRLFQPSP